MTAKIFQPSKSSMQSGKARTGKWVLQFEPDQRRTVDPLMGWTGSGDTRTQVSMRFATLDDAIAYARRNGLAFEVAQPQQRALKLQTYADNFR